MSSPVERVTITEVSLRDGLQIEPVVVPTAVKIALGAAFISAGFTDLEVGSFVSPGLVPTMADSDEVVAGLVGGRAALHALVFNSRGAERAIACGTQHVRFVVSASDGHSRANAGVSTADALLRVERAAKLLKSAGVRTEATIATAFVCPFDGDTQVDRVIGVAQRLTRTGVEVLHLADTIGAASPGDIRRTVTAIRSEVGDVPLGLHLHNTYGMASASVWEALSLGIRRFDAALGGLGGCPFAPGAAGNIATDDLVHMCHREGIVTGIDVDALTEVRSRLKRAVGWDLDSAMARTGRSPAPLRSH